MMDEKDREIQYLKEEIKDLTMRLSTVKIIVNKIIIFNKKND